MSNEGSVKSSKNTQESEASSGERYARETSENSILLLLQLLKQFKQNLPEDLAVKLDDSPDIDVKVGDHQVFKGTPEKPEVNRIQKEDVDYLAFATGKGQGFKHASLNRDVEILVAGTKVFEAKGGEVTLNLLGPQQSQKLTVALNSLGDTKNLSFEEAVSKWSEGLQNESPPQQQKATDQAVQKSPAAQRTPPIAQPSVTPEQPTVQQHGVQSPPQQKTSSQEQAEPPVQQPVDASVSSFGSHEGQQSTEVEGSLSAVPEPSIQRMSPELGRGLGEAKTPQDQYLRLAGVSLSKDFDQLKAEAISDPKQGERLERWVKTSAYSQDIPPSELEPVLRAGVMVAALEESGKPSGEIDTYISDTLNTYEDALSAKTEKAAPENTPSELAQEPSLENVHTVDGAEGKMSINLSPPEPVLDRQSQVIEAARHIVSIRGEGVGSGEHEFNGAHFTVNTYGDETKILDESGKNVAVVGGVGDRNDYAIPPDLEDSLLASSQALASFELEQGQEQEQDAGMELV